MAETIRKQFDVVVVGAGPAALAAAGSAVRAGAKVAMLDDNPAPGGQIWRGEMSNPSSDISKRLACLESAGVAILTNTHVIHHKAGSRILFAETTAALYEIEYSKLILATGARERVLPFPGWTLPNVMAAGGLQAMVKSGLTIVQKRVVVAGTGPLLLAVAAYLRKRGARVVAVCEQTTWRALAGFAFGLFRLPGKIWQALLLQRQLLGIPFWPNAWPLKASGRERLESVTILRKGKRRELACDYLACSFHLVPNTEVPALLGCGLSGGYVQVDESQQTSIPGVYCAGEPTGIGGLELSLLEGEIAGMAATGQGQQARALHHARRSAQEFANCLEKAFQLRPELRSLPDSGTIVCRCEDVTYARVAGYRSWRDAKNHTRCGMGPCQGRICGPATQFLFDWRPESVRPPIFPARVQSLASLACASVAGETGI